MHKYVNILALILLMLGDLQCNLLNPSHQLSQIPYPLMVSVRAGENVDIAIIDRDLSFSRLTDGEFNVAPEWSPDGQSIAYWTTIAGGLDEIFVMNADGTGKRNLTRTPSSYEQRPKWSPDGRMIAFDVLRETYGIGLIYADGSGQRFLTQSQRYNNITWEADGSALLFDKRVGTKQQIFSINVDGTNEHSLTPDTTKFFFGASVSPDGKYLAFQIKASDTTNILVVRERPSGSETTISEDALFPLWSPDASWLYFSERTQGFYRIFRSRLDGSGKQKVTSTLSRELGNHFVESITRDGQRVAFISTRGLESLIYVMNADGSDQHRVLDDPNAYRPRWKPR